MYRSFIAGLDSEWKPSINSPAKKEFIVVYPIHHVCRHSLELETFVPFGWMYIVRHFYEAKKNTKAESNQLTR